MNKLLVMSVVFVSLFGLATFIWQTQFSQSSAETELKNAEVFEPVTRFGDGLLDLGSATCPNPSQACGTGGLPIGTNKCTGGGLPGNPNVEKCTCSCTANGWICSVCKKGCNPNVGKCILTTGAR